MRPFDLIRFTLVSLRRQRFRSAMLVFSIAIGVLAVNLLTALGEGARQFIAAEFSLLGKNTIIVLPGRKETTGGMPPITGEAPRDLTLADAAVLAKQPGVTRVAPISAGTAEASAGVLNREIMVIGTNHHFFTLRQLTTRVGKILPELPGHQAAAVCVIGSKLRRELFGNQPALGQWIRADDRRFRVIGVLDDRGQSLGMDLSDVMFVPVANAQTLFDQEGLFRVFVGFRAGIQLDSMMERLRMALIRQHEGDEDFTLITQDSLLSAFDDIVRAITLGVGAIGAIALLVAGILIMNISWIVVSQRTREIGLLKALGATQRQVRTLFLSESLLIGCSGAALGVLSAHLILVALRAAYPTVPFSTPWWASISAVSVALLTAVGFALMPAIKASRMAPVDALMQKDHN